MIIVPLHGILFYNVEFLALGSLIQGQSEVLCHHNCLWFCVWFQSYSPKFTSKVLFVHKFLSKIFPEILNDSCRISNGSENIFDKNFLENLNTVTFRFLWNLVKNFDSRS